MSPVQLPWDLRIAIDGTSFPDRAQENDESLANLLSASPTGLLVPVLKTGAYTANGNELVIATAGTFTVTAPVAAAGRTFAVFNMGTGVITIQGAGGGSAFFGPGLQSGGTSGKSTLTLAQNAYVLFVSSATANNNWLMTGGGGMSGWITPTITGTWVAGAQVPQYAINYGDGCVHLRGSANTGVNATSAFTLNAGYRPSQQFVGASIMGGLAGFAQIIVAAAGTVALNCSAATANGVFLDACSPFLAEL